MSSSRGGNREGAGRKSAWKSGKTQTIRVPKVFVNRLMQIAHTLDSGGTIEIVTKSIQDTNDLITESKQRNDSVIKSNSVCPDCGFDDWKVEGYRTLKSGQKKQKRQCRNCDRIWSVAIG